MPIQCLIRANDLMSYKDVIKGMVSTVKDEPCVWGNRECLPDYVVVRIADATREQAEQFLEPWKNTFEYAVTDINVNTKQVYLSINPNIIQVLGEGKALKDSLRTLIVRDWNATIILHTQTSVTFTVPADSDLQAMRRQLYDVFDLVVGKRRYIFQESDVDNAVANDGFVETTREVALNRIIDRQA